MTESAPADEVPGVHSALGGIAWLVGTWWGFGVGGYATLEGFKYEQEITFSSDGRPFLKYESASWIVDEEGNRLSPGAGEVGWWRPGADPRELEVLIAHHTGLVEIYVGEVTFSKIDLATDVVARTATAKDVSGVKRLYGKVEEDLAYAIDMAAMGQPLQSHLSARLQRVAD